MSSLSKSRSGVSVSAFALVVGLAFPLHAQIASSQKQIRWNSGYREVVDTKSAAQTKVDLDRLSKNTARSHIIVHFGNAITKADRLDLEEYGLRLLSPLGGHSYFASLDKQIQSDEISRSGVLSISEITRNHKLHQDLAHGLIRPWMIRKNAAAGNTELQEMLDSGLVLSEEFIDRGFDPMIAVLVMFHKDEPYRVESKRLAKLLGGEVISEIYTVNTVTMHLPLSKVEQLANDDSVQWIEPPLPPMEDVNAENRVLTGADTLNASPYDLDGTGITVLVYDGGKVRPHQDFGSRLTIGASDTRGTSNHATHVAGTIGGNGTLEFANRGMAPGVDLVSYGFEPSTDGFQPGFLYSDPGDLEADYTEALALYGIDIANNSIGSNIEPNGYPCEWTGNYGITSAVIDAIVRGSLGEPMRIVWANGNERSRSRCLGDDFGNHGEFYSTAPPATAKNHITVGSVDSDTDLTSYFSSWGPTDDGRLKPDISAPGCDSNDGVGVLSTVVGSSDGVDGYTSACGTSMAAPTVTGICALILQQYQETFPARNTPMNATLKALLANTAVDRGNVGPDYSYGYGSVRGVEAVSTVLDRNIIEGNVGQGGVYRFEVTVHPGETELKVTVAWDDIPGAPNVSQSLINNLDLRIIDSIGTVYLPWTLDPSDPSAPAIQTQPDSLNNIEQVQIDMPMPGMYTVEVSGTLIADAGVQSFGAVSSSQISDCSSEGYISLSASVISCETGSVVIQVADCDLNISDVISETVDVLVTSETQPSGVIITLTETQPDSSVFEATLTHSTAGGADIQVISGDTMTASYTDTDTGFGSSAVSIASLAVDCSPPTVIERSVDMWYNYATINIDADERVSCRIMFGEAEFGLTNTFDSYATLSSTHAILVEDLTEFTEYVYSIEITDVVGNTSVYDNGGAGYPFTTIGGPVTVFEFLVDDTDPGWARTGDWEFGNPTGLMGNPSEAVTGDNVLGYDLDDWYPWHMEEEYLTSDVMDFTGIYEVRLDFERWLGIAINAYSHAAIEARAGDGEWETVYWHGDAPWGGGRISPTEWEHFQYELFEIADNQPEFQIRWVMGEASIHSDECGWNIDDIVFTGVVPPPPPSVCAADLNDDGELNFFDVSAFLNAFSAQDPIADLTDDGLFNFFDVSAFLNLFSSGCP